MISIFNFVLLGIFFFISWKLVNRKKLGKAPNGPFPLPVVGNALSFSTTPHVAMGKWANKYGKIFQMYIGGNRHIVLSDLDLIKKAFQHPDLQGRPRIEILEFDGASHGISLTNGQEWQDQRRFTLRHLRDFGFGKNYMGALIQEEVDELLVWLKSQGNNPVCLNIKFTLAVINSLWRIITGKRFSHNDPKLLEIFDQFFMSNRNVNPMLILFMPRLAKLFPNISGWNKIRQVMVDSMNLVKEPISGHQEEFSREIEENPRDFIDAYLGEISKTTDPNSSFYGSMGETSLSAVALDLFQAGSMTTSTTLAWAVLFLILHLDIQKKFQKEIDDVIGQSRHPSLADKSKMVYTEALTCEIHRKSSLAPFGFFHAATENTTFEGYDMPKGTVIVPNQYYVHHDPKIWGDPEKFRPERFINPEGTIQKKEYLIPFSIGKRVCPGETLARDEIFLFLTNLFQRFEIRADASKPMPSMDEPVAMLDLLEAPEFFVILKDRRE